MISCVIVDDEQNAIDDLIYLLKKYQLPVRVVSTATSGKDGLVAILQHKPQLLFLDVVMPGMSGFEMLDLLPELNFQLIITTSVDKYAIQAIRSSALDFLLKPVKASELKQAVARAEEMKEIPSKTQVHILEDNLKSKNRTIKKIALTLTDGVELVNLDDILYFASDGNYTTVHLPDSKKVLVSKPIGKFEEIVQDTSFFRLHNSFLVNMNKINKFIRTDGGYVILENGENISVARSRKNEFLEWLGKM